MIFHMIENDGELCFHHLDDEIIKKIADTYNLVVDNCLYEATIFPGHLGPGQVYIYHYYPKHLVYARYGPLNGMIVEMDNPPSIPNFQYGDESPEGMEIHVYRNNCIKYSSGHRDKTGYCSGLNELLFAYRHPISFDCLNPYAPNWKNKTDKFVVPYSHFVPEEN